ncbi:unnamed protein product, partial [Meganyctiphanes norvegica]
FIRQGAGINTVTQEWTGRCISTYGTGTSGLAPPSWGYLFSFSEDYCYSLLPHHHHFLHLMVQCKQLRHWLIPHRRLLHHWLILRELCHWLIPGSQTQKGEELQGSGQLLAHVQGQNWLRYPHMHTRT